MRYFFLERRSRACSELDAAGIDRALAGRFEDVEEDVLALLQVVQGVPAGHFELGPVQEFPGGVISRRLASARGRRGLQGEVHGRGADDEPAANPARTGLIRSADSHPRERAAGATRSGFRRLGIDAVRDAAGSASQSTEADGLPDLGLDGVRLLRGPARSRRPRPGTPGIYRDVQPLRRSPSLLRIAREEGRPIRFCHPACAHRSIPNTGASRFLRFWTALKWSDLAVPTEICMAVGDLIELELVVVSHDEDHLLPLGQRLDATGRRRSGGPRRPNRRPGPRRRTGISSRGLVVSHSRCFLAVLPVAVDADVLGHLQEPALEGVPRLVEAGFLIEPEEGLLDGVEGVLPVAEDGIGHDEHLLLVKPDDRHEGLAVPLLDPLEERGDLGRLALSIRRGFTHGTS